MHVPPEMFKAGEVMAILSAAAVLTKVRRFLNVELVKLTLLALLLVAKILIIKAPIPSSLWCNYLTVGFRAKINSLVYPQEILVRCW